MSQKYRHHGYRDTEREEDRGRSRRPPQNNLTTEEKIQRRSLRKATDRTAHEVVRCHDCGRNVQDFGTIDTSTTCPHCNSPLHCCRACTHFDSSARWQCRADIKEAVSDKGKANDCAQYRPRLVLDVTGRRTSPQRTDDARTAFDNLFKR